MRASVPAVQALIEMPRADDERELARRRHREQLRIGHAERLRRLRGRADDKQIGVVPARRGAVNNGLAVRHEPRIRHGQPVECLGLKRHRVRLNRDRPPRGEEAQDGSRRHRRRERSQPPAPRFRRSDNDGRPYRRSRHGFQRKRHIARRLKALLRLLLKTAADDAIDRRRDSTNAFCEVRGIVLQNRGHRLGSGVARECAATREHFVDHDAE